jgi:tetratricopeptide (TPR) repeat protein
MPRRLHAILIAAAALWPPLGAAAQADPVVELARALYEKGQRQYELGHFAEARQLFESAYQAKAAPALLFNIAQCHRKLGDLRDAASLYRSFLRADPDSRSAPLARELLQQVEEAMERETALRPAPPEALPVAAPIAQPVPSHVRWPALAAAGTAGTLLAVAIVESLGARSATNELAQLHQQGTVSPTDDARLRSEAESKRSRATVLYVVSAVAAAAGAGLWFAF